MQLTMIDDLHDEKDDHALEPELRAELMKISTQLKTTAASIDAICQRKRAKDHDENGEPTWRFGAKVAIPKDIFFTKRMVKYALDRKFTQEQTAEMVAAFVRFYNKNGKKWQDWSRVWFDWVRREEQRVKDGTDRVMRSSKDNQSW